MYKKALNKGDLNLARNISSMLMTLQGFLSGRISLIENVPISDKISISVD
jgi:hypothetical protein